MRPFGNGWHGAIGCFRYTGPVRKGYANFCVRPLVAPLCAPLPGVYGMLLRTPTPRNQDERKYFLFDAAPGLMFESIYLFCEAMLDITHMLIDIFLSRVYR